MATITNSGRAFYSRSIWKSGFSLVELMCVIAVVSILASVTAPSIMGLISGDQLTNNAYQLSGLVQQARTTAISEHTYVWLGFSSTTSNGAPALLAATLQINSGVATDLPSTASNYRMVSKVATLRNTSLATVSNYSSLVGVDSADNTDAGSQTFSFGVPVPGKGSATFSDWIVFGPDGQVYLPASGTGAISSPTPCVGLGINASPSNKIRTAALQIRGMSGQVSVFRQ
jgi:prepilin-type N-terminal cleavage/methylation domain-containing protein